MSEGDVAEITRIFEVELPSCVKAHDGARYVALYLPNGVWCPPNAPDCFGTDANLNGVTALLTGVNVDPHFVADEAYVIESDGYVFGRSTLEITPQGGGQTMTVHNRELWLFKKVEEVWKIAKVVFNGKPGPNH